MPRIHFTLSDGAMREVEAAAGLSVMEAARAAGVPGIVAECGGAAMCATCHVYVAEEWLALLPPMTEFEDELLEGTGAPRAANSRLSCQIKIGDAIDGLQVGVPETQY